MTTVDMLWQRVEEECPRRESAAAHQCRYYEHFFTPQPYGVVLSCVSEPNAAPLPRDWTYSHAQWAALNNLVEWF